MVWPLFYVPFNDPFNEKEFTTKHHGAPYQGVNIYLYGFEVERNKTPKPRLAVLQTYQSPKKLASASEIHSAGHGPQAAHKIHFDQARHATLAQSHQQ
jgi:hypothetical protein